MAPDTTLPPAITSNTRPAGVGTGGAASADGVGADGVGDPYYPKAGNSGYDVQRYDLVMDVRIKGADHLDATATAAPAAPPRSRTSTRPPPRR
mgnify:CR=1 FL=1